ncbi:WYL domain-containing protein [Paracoccus jeotgali]|uniref:WYL domain-containing protein n=1 Tax=Paracoccus jeotgali TaxID=2065379 RepID=UPI0028AD4F73|nr:WYL domain-containing protein [Paracoccus jeotgali]
MIGLSEATISRDQAAFYRMCSENEGVLLHGGKLEVPDPEDLSLPADIVEPSLAEWLRVMLAAQYISTSGMERADPSSQTIRMITNAIHDRRALFIRYASRSVSHPAWRAVSPHSVVHVVGRHHVRCFDHGKGRYSDFVLTRILAATFDRSDTPEYVDLRRDDAWRQMVNVRLSLKVGEAPLLGRLDYGLDETGCRIIKMRKALVPYFIDHRYEGFESPVEIQEGERRK